MISVPRVRTLLRQVRHDEDVFPVLFRPGLIRQVEVVLIQGRLLMQRGREVVRVHGVRTNRDLVFSVHNTATMAKKRRRS